MDDPADGESSKPEALRGSGLPKVVNIAPTGNLVLDVTFQNSKATLKAARKAQPRPIPGKPAPPPPEASVRLGFRVDLATLQRQSQYFEKLLSDTRFKEAKAINATLDALSARGIAPSKADVGDLPWVEILDDDEATRYARRETVFAALLRTLHGQEATTSPVTMHFAATLAVLADRFDCAAPLSKCMSGGLKLKWPVTQKKPLAGEDGRMSRSSENVLRQKILVSWLLSQPAKFQNATRELIMNGSCKWTPFPEDDEADEATWWYLQDGLEQELQYRRECIFNTIASVQRHFIALYTSRDRQCKLGYDSSAACDSYQLGEMLKFLTARKLMFLVDFSPSSLDAIADTSLLPVETILATLQQCPNYQIDKNHTNCGLRTRIQPIIYFIHTLLSASSVPILWKPWRSHRQAASWIPPDAAGAGKRGGDESAGPFLFTRAVSGDPRLQLDNAMGTGHFAREVFTAGSWNWTADV